MEGPTLYVDLMSQPSRACALFCRLNGLPVKVRFVKLGDLEHRQPWYLEKNPLGQVPFLEDGSLRLPESAAILCYLAQKYSVAEHWYPRDLTSRAVVNSAMHWQHTTLRSGERAIVYNKVIAPARGWPSRASAADEGLVVLKRALTVLESYWLNGRPFMCGPKISLADLLCACEIQQLKLLVKAVDGEDLDSLLAGKSSVLAWHARVEQLCQPYFDDVSVALRAFSAHRAKKLASKI